MCRCRVSGAEEPAGQQRNKPVSARCLAMPLRCDFEKLYSTSVASVLKGTSGLVSKCLYTGPTEVRVTARGGVKSRIPKSSELSYDA